MTRRYKWPLLATVALLSFIVVYYMSTAPDLDRNSVEDQNYLHLDPRGQALTPKMSPLEAKPSVQQPATLSNHEISLDEMVQLLKAKIEAPIDRESIYPTIACKNQTLIRRPCVDETCISKLPSDLTDRLKKVVLNSKFAVPAVHAATVRDMAKDVPKSDVILLSAASANHYNELQALFKGLHAKVYPNLSNFSSVFVDLGLTAENAELTKNNCRCHYMKFPFDKFPPHYKTLSYFAWKPTIIKAMLQRANYVMYMDTSIRFKSDPSPLFKRAHTFGMQFIPNGDVITIHTDLKTFDYFDMQTCTMEPYPELAAGFGIYHNEPFVQRGFLDPWLACALKPKCMSPVGLKRLRCPHKERIWGQCHRYDLSALVLILGTLYQQDLHRLALPTWATRGIVTIQRRQHASYFH